MDLQSLPWYGQFLVFLFIGAVVFAFFYFMVYSETQAQIDGLSSQIEQLDVEIKTAEKKEGKLKQLQDEVKRREAVLEKLKEILPEKNEIAGIIKNIGSLIVSAGLDVQRWAPPLKQQKEIYVEYQYAIDLEGGYHNLGMFFDQLSKIKKIFTVGVLEIKPVTRRESPHIIRATFKTSTYTYFERKEQPKKTRSSRRRRRG